MVKNLIYKIIKNYATAVVLIILLVPVISFASGGGEHAELGSSLPLWSMIPFIGILLSIALFPLLAPHFWHEHFPKIAAMWAVVFAVPFLYAYKGDALYEISHIYLID